MNCGSYSLTACGLV